MNIYIKIVIGIAAVAVLGTAYFLLSASKSVKAATDRGNYSIIDSLELTVKNNTEDQICFSSCYPYFLERQADGDWQKYSYGGKCDEAEVTGNCMKAGETKKFQLTLDEAVSGLHRLNIPVCVGCVSERVFRANSSVVSNTFNIK